MGFELRRQLREALGPGITGLQRAVALEIADDANDDTRRSMAALEDLARWTGASSTAVVRNALKRLATVGWEFRVAIGKGRDGRILYAVPGTRMTFEVPRFALPEGVATAPSEGAPAHSEGAGAHSAPSEGGAPAHSEGAPATPSTPQGGARAHSEGAPAHSEGAGAPPSSSYSSDPSSQPAGQPAASAPAHRGIPDAAAPLVEAIQNAGVNVRWPFRGNEWFPLLALIEKCGLPAMADYAIKAGRRADVESARYFLRGWAELPPKAQLPATAGNVVPLAKPRGQQETDDLFDRAMTRAQARTQESS